MKSVLEIISKKLDDNDPMKGYFKIKDGKIIDYGNGLKKGKVIVHPTNLEGILRLEENGFEKEYKIKISYNYNDIFDIDMYMEYLGKNDLIKKYNSKIKYVSRTDLEKTIFNDLKFVDSIKNVQDYFINELGISPKVYYKLKRKGKIEELNEKIKIIEKIDDKIEKHLDEAKKITKIFEELKNNEIDISSLNRVSEESTGFGFEEIAKQSDEIFEIYADKIAEDLATIYFATYNDKLGYQVVKRITKVALKRAREDYFSDNLFDYLVINNNYNEIKDTVKKITEKYLSFVT